MRALFLLVMIFTLNNAFATPLKLNYSLFFGYMKTTLQLHHQYVTTAFYLRDIKHGHDCKIEKAYMAVDNRHKDIHFTESGQLLPFFSDQWRKDGAMIEVILKEKEEQCALVVMIKTKKNAINDLDNATLKVIRSQLKSTYQKNAGMIGQYFVPEFLGVRLQLNSPINKQQIKRLGPEIQIAKDGSLLLTNKYIAQIVASKKLDIDVRDIMPWIGS